MSQRREKSPRTLGSERVTAVSNWAQVLWKLSERLEKAHFRAVPLRVEDAGVLIHRRRLVMIVPHEPLFPVHAPAEAPPAMMLGWTVYVTCFGPWDITQVM